MSNSAREEEDEVLGTRSLLFWNLSRPQPSQVLVLKGLCRVHCLHCQKKEDMEEEDALVARGGGESWETVVCKNAGLATLGRGSAEQNVHTKL
jgi:hypothetical protein